MQILTPETRKYLFFHAKTSEKTPEILEVFGAPRIGVGPYPFSAISLLQAAHARNTPPPLAAHGAGGGGAGWQGGRVAGRQAAGLGWRAWGWRHGGWLAAGGMVAWRHGAWCMDLEGIGFD